MRVMSGRAEQVGVRSAGDDRCMGRTSPAHGEPNLLESQPHSTRSPRPALESDPMTALACEVTLQAG